MSSLKNISTKSLEKELSRRRELKIKSLKQELDRVQGKINSLTSLPVSTAGEGVLTKIKKTMKKTSVGDSKKSLKKYILEIANDDVIRTNDDFKSALKASGWSTTSSKPYYLIASALTSLEKEHLINRVSKGKYQRNQAAIKGE